MKTRTIRLAVVAFAAACAFALAACGGGGGGSTPNQTAGTWDQMKWDEKNWQ